MSLEAEYEAADPIAKALNEAINRWDEEAEDDETWLECYENGWNLSEFIALVFVRDGWKFSK